MKPTRRTFIRDIGIMLASLLATHKSQSAPTSLPDPLRAALRQCWLDLHDTELQSAEENDFSRELQQRYTDALGDLVAAGATESAVADEIGVAFEEAIAHIQRQMATCYIAFPSEYFPRMDLMQQAAALEKLATQSDINPGTITQAQAALERNIEWLSRFRAGQTPTEFNGIEVSPAVTEAARILVGLLLNKRE